MNWSTKKLNCLSEVIISGRDEILSCVYKNGVLTFKVYGFHHHHHLFHFLSLLLFLFGFIFTSTKMRRCVKRHCMEQPICSWYANGMLSTLLRPECLPQTIKQVIDELLVFLSYKINYTESKISTCNMNHVS